MSHFHFTGSQMETKVKLVEMLRKHDNSHAMGYVHSNALRYYCPHENTQGQC